MLSKTDYTSNGSTKRFQITFPFLFRSSIIILVNNIQVTFNFITNSYIELDDVPNKGETISISRNTDITNILNTYNAGDIFDSDEVNQNKLQLIFALQEFVENESSSLSSTEADKMFLDLDMNGNKIINLANATDNLDAMTFKQVLDLTGLEKQAGCGIGDTILSTRTDQTSELVGGIQKWLPRDIEQQLVKTDYPELALIYPETPGGLVSITNDLRYDNYANSQTDVYYDPTTEEIYYQESGASITKLYKVDKFGTETFLKDFASGSTNNMRFAVHDDVVAVITLKSGNPPAFQYSLDGGSTFNNGTFSGVATTGNPVDLIHMNGTFFTVFPSGQTLLYSTNGIDWTSITWASFGIDIARIEGVNSLTTAINFPIWSVDGTDFILNSAILSSTTGKKSTVYRINSGFTSSVEIKHVPSSQVIKTGTSIAYKLDGKMTTKKEVATTDPFVRFTEDFGETFIRDFDLETVVSNITHFQNIGRLNNTWLVSVITNSNTIHIIKSDDDWLTASSVHNSTDFISASIGNIIITEANTDDISSDKLFFNIFQEHFETFDAVFGSNLTFDMPIISAPAGDTNQKNYTKGKNL